MIIAYPGSICGIWSSEMKNLVRAVLLVLAGTSVFSAPAGAVLIDFDSVDSFTSSGRIDRIGDVTFSRDLYNLPDGFELYNGVAYNYYGERGEFFSFDAPVTLQSMDVAGSFLTLPQATALTIELLDSGNNVLQSQVLTSGTTQTLVFNQSDVASVTIDFTGGAFSFYGHGRYHAWYTVDNIAYEIGTTSEIAEPGLVAIFGLGLTGLGFARRRKPTA